MTSQPRRHELVYSAVYFKSPVHSLARKFLSLVYLILVFQIHELYNITWKDDFK